MPDFAHHRGVRDVLVSVERDAFETDDTECVSIINTVANGIMSNTNILAESAYFIAVQSQPNTCKIRVLT